MTWSKGPTAPMLDGARRMIVKYRCRNLDADMWEGPFEIAMTLKEPRHENAFRRIYERISIRKKMELDVMEIREFSKEALLDQAMSLVDQKTYDEASTKRKLEMSDEEYEERAREAGIWVPPKGGMN